MKKFRFISQSSCIEAAAQFERPVMLFSGGKDSICMSWLARVRFRTIGDMTCTGAVESIAESVEDIVREIAATRTTERDGRADDKRSEAAMEDRLEKLAAATHRTKSFYARQAIERYLEDIEDLYLAEKAYGEYLEGKSKSKRIEDIVRENKL